MAPQDNSVGRGRSGGGSPPRRPKMPLRTARRPQDAPGRRRDAPKPPQDAPRRPQEDPRPKWVPKQRSDGRKKKNKDEEGRTDRQADEIIATTKKEDTRKHKQIELCYLRPQTQLFFNLFSVIFFPPGFFVQLFWLIFYFRSDLLFDIFRRFSAGSVGPFFEPFGPYFRFFVN